MKNIIFLPLFFFFGILSAQDDLEGSWKLVEVNGAPVSDVETIRIYQDGYFSLGSKNAENNQFIYAAGGEFSTDNGYSEKYDFYTKDSTVVGQEKDYEIDLDNDQLILAEFGGDTETWERISDATNDLSGNWVITGRQRNGEIRRSTPGARRTIKILGGDRFQWVAFNSETGEFSGTGGGTYTADDGQYVENIEFFSRDNSRVGAKLPFDYEVKDGEWHHSGKSSKGDPMYEIWSPYNEAYKKEK